MVSSLRNSSLLLCLPTQLSDSITAIPLALGYPQTTRAHFPRNRGCPHLSSLDLAMSSALQTQLSPGQKRSDSFLPHDAWSLLLKRTCQFLFPVGGKLLPRQPVDLGHSCSGGQSVPTGHRELLYLLFPSWMSNSPGTAATVVSLGRD